jgi:hypothetical protein
MDGQIRKDQPINTVYQFTMHVLRSICRCFVMNLTLTCRCNGMEWNGNEEVAVVAGINFITWPQLGGSRKMGSDENTMATDEMKQTRAPFSKAAAF